MGEEFEAAGVYGGNWWNSSSGKFGSSHCNSFINMNDHMVSFGLTAAGELVDMKGGTRSSEDSSDDGGATTIDSTLQMMGIGLSSSSSTTDWNDQPLIRGGGRAESNYKPIFQEDLNYHQETGVNDFSPHAENFTMQANQVGFNSIQQPSLSSDHFRTTCQGLATFPISTSSYVYPTTLMQTLFDNNSPPDQSAYDDGSINYSSNENNYRTNLSEFLPSLPKFSSTVKPKQHVSGQMNLSNNTPFCNASSVSALNDIRASFLSSAHSQLLSMTFEEKPKCPDLTPKEEIRNSGSVVKKICNEPAFKRPRLETPSPLPTFKVRKEKLGDRITALQQLVSPFGKTDTASVLHEAIEYIKLLHDQVNVLSTQYMKNGVSMQCQQIPEKVKETEGAKQDLKSRGLCLVPVSSTFPVTAETTTDFWTPNFVGTFR